jgi:hypothetical protein
MTTFPSTLVCTGCGSWLKLDVKKSGSLYALALCGATLLLGYFSLYFLILLPVYFVLSLGPLQSLSVDLVKKRKAELWTISRRTGSLRPLDQREAEAQRDVQLSSKLTGTQPFRKARRARGECDDFENGRRKSERPKTAYDLNELPTGLPH